MKTILKLSVAVLIVFAMVGMASAVSNFAVIDLTANGTNYDITFSWDSDLSLTDATIDDDTTNTISETTFSATGASFEDLQLTVGTSYTIIFSDASTEAFEILATATPSALGLESTDSDDRDYTLSWTNIGDLEIYNGTGWDGSTVDTLVVDSSALADPFNISYRVIDSTGTNISLSENLSFQSITLTYVDGANFVNWTVAGINMADIEFYVNDGTFDLPPIVPDVDTINATGLISGTTYTLYVREDSAVGYGLYVSSAVTIAAPPAVPLIDWSNTDEVDAANTTGNDLSFEAGQQLSLTAETLENCSFDWSLECTDNGSVMETQTTVTDDTIDTFNYTFTAMGNYTLTLIVTEVADSTNTEPVTWDITVTEKSTGKRIWTDGMPTNYTWDARSFSGFYYNLDTGEGKESMKITNIGRTLASRSITYTTEPSDTNYSYSGWNKYSVIGFMGDNYYAGDLMAGGNLSKVLIDESSRTMLRVGQYYALEEGYSLKVNQINLNGNSVQFILEKDGKEIDSGFASSGTDFVYEKRINNRDIEFVKVHVDSVFQGTESSIVQISGVFQISDQLTPLKSGEKIGKMEIRSVSGTLIEMTNSESVTLSQNSTVSLMGKMNFIVSDNSTLKFAPVIEYTEPGIYEIRGTVSDFGTPNYDISVWTPDNFEGFYFDINDDTGSMERITINETLTNSSRTIARGNLTYSSNVTNVTYGYRNWGEYQVIGFMGEKYFAGSNGTSLLSGGNLSKVLMDDNDKRSMYMGQYLTLEGGYALKVNQIDINGNIVQFILEKDGREVDSGFARSNETYVYEMSVNRNDKVDAILIHVDSVFQGTESSIVLINGVFQISDQLTRVEGDAKYGKMKVSSFTSSGIELINDDSVSLSSGNTVDFMTVGNSSMSFKVGDNSSVLRFAPIVSLEIGSNTSLEVEVTPSTVTVGDPVVITVKDRGVTIEGVIVTANGTSVGTTNSSGMISYTPNSVGAIRITADKAGYVNGSATLTVTERLRNMTISVSPEQIYRGTEGTIRVTDALDGSAVSGASITYGTLIGQTDASGILRYNFTQSGTLQASREGYVNTTRSVSVLQNFTYSNFSFNKENLTAKSTIKLSFDVTNVGLANDSHDLTVSVRNTSTGEVVNTTTKTVSVDAGKSKSTSFSFKVPTEGSYSVIFEEDGVIQPIQENIAAITVGPSNLLGSISGSYILYIVVGAIGLVVLAALGLVAYLFGVKGANTSNYSEVGKEVWGDIKSKLHLSKKMK